AHRKHASTYGMIQFMPTRGMGFLIEKELKFLDPLLHNPAKPFWAVLGGSKVTDKIKTIELLMREAKKRELPLIVPADTNQGFDIGPKTVEKFSQALSRAKTIFWNGPLGWFEKPEYAKGTFDLAKFVAELSAVKVVGGGDTVSAIKQSGYADKFDHLSTGGGAVLEYLEGNGLPGIDILKLSTREKTVQQQQ